MGDVGEYVGELVRVKVDDGLPKSVVVEDSDWSRGEVEKAPLIGKVQVKKGTLVQLLQGARSGTSITCRGMIFVTAGETMERWINFTRS